MRNQQNEEKKPSTAALNMLNAAEAGGGPVGRAEVEAAREELTAYRAAREELNARILDDRACWSMVKTDGSGWLFNSVINKHADAMDALPEPCVLPREEDDRERARELSDILPVVLDNCGYESLYSDLWWSKLIDGTAVTGVFWEPGADRGRGDLRLCRIDLLNVYWEPGVRDVQDSASVYTLDRRPDAALREEYPQLRDVLTGEKAADDPFGATDSGYSTVVDRYYKKDGKLHFMRFVGDRLLYASENDPAASGGWYAHGKYPFVFDPMYPEPGGVCGFGAVDVAKRCQRTIDLLDGAISRNALANSRPRYFVRVDGGGQ